jgi:pimeloyl-ACP methyl ester carboxylesterase
LNFGPGDASDPFIPTSDIAMYLPDVHRLVAAAALCMLVQANAAPAEPTYGVELQGFDYPHRIEHFEFTSQGQTMQMAYMDVAPSSAPNGRVAVLMHGKNFCGATWDTTITALSDAGYRVVVPDQIGFCASTKPARYQYSFQQLAANTQALLQGLGVKQATLVAHSTGGMIATRYALMWPQAVDQLVLVDPIGLEDWQAKGVPTRSVDQWTERELAQTADKIRAYERTTYYAGEWKPAYDRWVDMLAGLQQGPGRERVARNSALIYDMIQTQPVVHEFPLLKVPTVLMIGTRDTTAIGSDIAPPEVKARIGHYDQLGPQAARAIPHARLIEFEGLGHAPQIQAPETFDKRLLDAMASR